MFELRTQLGIVSAGLHQRFVAGHSAGFITGEDAVVSGFFATQGFLLNVEVTDALREQACHALARVEALHLRTKNVNEMSTGEARRVLIARVYADEGMAPAVVTPVLTRRQRRTLQMQQTGEMTADAAMKPPEGKPPEPKPPEQK